MNKDECLISREAAIEILEEYQHGIEYGNANYAEAHEKMLTIPYTNYTTEQPNDAVKAANDVISRQAAIKAICTDGTWLERHGVTTLTLVEAKQRAVDLIQSIPPADITETETCQKCQETTERVLLNQAEKIPKWIPVSERLPEEPYGCLVTVWDTNPMTGDGFENILPYFVGWDGEQWNDSEGMRCPFEVIAWQPLPEPYKAGDSE